MLPAEKLKILLYIEPTLEREDTNFRTSSTFKDLPIIPLLDSKLVDVHLICSEFTYLHAKTANSFKNIYKKYNLNNHITIMSQSDTRALGISAKKQRLSIYNLNLSDNIINKYKSLYKTKLKEFVPDIIISYESPAEHLRRIFPNTLLLNQTQSSIRRSAIPQYKDFIFDPYILKKGIIKENLNEIVKLKFSKEQYQLLEKYKLIFKDAITHKISNNINQIVKDLYKRFDKLYILPLQGSHFNFEGNTNFDNQLDAICYVMDQAPKNCGIIVTEHSLYQKELTTNNLLYLRQKYPNFIYLEGLKNIPHLSTLLLYLVNGICIVSSFLFYIALLLQKEVFLLGEWGIPQLASGTQLFKPDNKINKHQINNTLLFLLNNLTISNELVNDPKYFVDYLQNLFNEYKQNTLNYKTFLQFNHLQPTLLTYPTQEEILPEVLEFQKKYTDENSKKICKQIVDRKVISFDIFDTLLVRSVFQPTDVFKLMETDKSIGKILPNFAETRIFFEEFTHHTVKSKKPIFQDITIDEIYENIQKELKLSDSDTAYLKQKEIESEQKVLYSRSYAKDLFNLAKSLNKKIILISDMYLSASILANILKDNGYIGWDKLYVSSEIKLKKSTGDLFTYIINDLKVNASTILHFGDNYQADILKGREKKLVCVHLPKTTDILKRLSFFNAPNGLKLQEIPTTERMLFAVMANKLFSNPFIDYDVSSLWNGNWYNRGYITLGPIIFNSIISMVHYAKQNQINNIHFILRDGFIPKQIFENMQNLMGVKDIRSNYLLLNRYNMYCYLLINNPYVLLLTGIFNKNQKVSKIVDFFFKNQETLNLVISKLSTIKVYPYNSVQQVKKLLPEIIQILASFIDKNQMYNFEEYLNQTIDKKNNNLIFDVGYRGTSHLFLSQVGFEDIKAYYISVHDSKDFYPSSQKEGFINDKFLQLKILNNQTNSQPLFEYAISYPYSISNMLEELNITNYHSYLPQNETIDNVDLLLLMQQGILDFANDCIKYCNKFLINYKPTPYTSYQLMQYFTTITSQKDIFKLDIPNSNFNQNLHFQVPQAKKEILKTVITAPTFNQTLPFSEKINFLLNESKVPNFIKEYINIIHQYGKSSKKVKLKKIIVKYYLKFFYKN